MHVEDKYANPARPSMKWKQEFKVPESEEYKWYGITLFNDRAYPQLIQKMKKDGKEDFVIELFVPEREYRTTRYRKPVVKKERPLGYYAFIKAKMCSELFWGLPNIEGMSWLIEGKYRVPQPVDDAEIEKMMKKVKVEDEVRTTTGINEYDKILVKEGPFAGFKGLVVKGGVEITEHGFKVKISLMIFNRETVVEFLENQVEKIA